MGAEDMANLAEPVSAPCCFWTFGCIDPKVWDAAEARGTLSKDVHGGSSHRVCFLYKADRVFPPSLRQPQRLLLSGARAITDRCK